MTIPQLKLQKYASEFDLSVPAIRHKYEHSLRVEDLCGKIAESIDLPERDIYLARVMGLMHDIGRFYQWHTFGTYSDRKSICHAQFGADLIRTTGLFDGFGFELNPDEKTLILTTIEHHSDRILPDTLVGSPLLFSFILRDADKLDIVATAARKMEEPEMFSYCMGATKDEMEHSSFSKNLVLVIDGEEVLDSRLVSTAADDILLYFSFAYQLRFAYTKVCMLEGHYLDKMHDSFRFRDRDAQDDFDHVCEVSTNTLMRYVNG